jgi:hypothetical protein
MQSITANGSKGHHKFTLSVNEDSQSAANNTSTVGFNFTISSLGGGWNWEGWGANISYVVTVNGTRYTGTIPIYDGNSTVSLKSGKINVAHNTDGTKSFSYSFSVTDTSGQTYTCGNASASGTMALNTIARYLSINSVEVTNKTETSVVVKWSVSHPRSSTYYSFDNGVTWIGSATDGETLAADNKSGSFNILKLSPNTTYNLKLKFRRADNDLWTEGSNQSFTTYDFPHVTATPDFVIGDAMYLALYNPLGRTVTATMFGDDGSVIWSATGWTGNSIGSNNAPTDIENLYRSIPNKRSGGYKMRTQYGDSVREIAGGTYSIKGNEVPTINGLGYHDGAEWVVNVTKDDKQIVQNKSDLLATAIAATPQYWAGSITEYVFECNGASRTESQPGSYSLGTVNSTQNVNLTLTVVDSRGLSASKTIEVTMVPHTDPTAIVTLKRKNNYEDETYLTVDGSVSPVNDKNKMAIKYQYKVSGGSFGAFVDIGDNETHTLSLDKNSVYVFNVVVTDSFGATNYNKEHTLGKGVFPLFIDVKKNSVGVNKFPASDNGFEASGLISLGERQTITLEMGQSVEVSIPFEQCSGLVNFRINGGNLEIAKLFYVFRNNEFFGTHKMLVDESHNNTSAAVPVEPRNGTYAYIFKITNNHSSVVTIRYGMLKLC